jgi:hypothetical protein
VINAASSNSAHTSLFKALGALGTAAASAALPRLSFRLVAKGEPILPCDHFPTLRLIVAFSILNIAGFLEKIPSAF